MTAYVQRAVGEPVLYQVADAAAIITINRPHRYNALDNDAATGLAACLERAAADPTVRAVAVTGAGAAFSSGLDLHDTADFASLVGREDTPVKTNLERTFHPIVRALRTMAKPTVALVNGPAVGIGASIALACDLVLMNEQAYFQIAFVGIGLIPDGGATALLTARTGAGRAFGAALLGDKIPAAEALTTGLANRLAPTASFDTDARAFMARLAAGPTVAYAATKKAINAVAYHDLENQLDLESTLQDHVARSADAIEGVGAFKDKRPARFEGR